jgi:hypothetical protein
MASTLDLALQRALAIRLNLQISLSSLALVEEWMDIHLDRWLEHIPMPPDMPDGYAVDYSAMVGSDLRRIAWSAWGDPRGFVPRMADYFKLCNIAKSDIAILDQVGEVLEPKIAGSWIGVWGKKVTTGWSFMDPQPWSKIESLFGTHEAKYQLKKFVEICGATQIERFVQSIGDNVFSEVEVKLPGDTIEAQLEAANTGFVHFTGSGIIDGVRSRLAERGATGLSMFVRVRGGKIARVAVSVPTTELAAVQPLCEAAKVGYDERMAKLVGALGGKVRSIEYGRAGEHAGVDVFVEPTEPTGKKIETPPPSSAN